MSYRLAVAVGVLSVSALVIGGSRLPAQTRAQSVPAADQQRNPVPKSLQREHQGIENKRNLLPQVQPDEVQSETVLPQPSMPHR
jgi:hypothetical protein